MLASLHTSDSLALVKRIHTADAAISLGLWAFARQGPELRVRPIAYDQLTPLPTTVTDALVMKI